MGSHHFWHGLDRHLPRLGFGTWQLSGPHEVDGRPNGWGKIDAGRAIDLICEALDRGIRFFDTAQGYGFGRSEKLLGEALGEDRLGDEAVVCTKLPMPARGASDFRLPAGWLEASIDVSRRRLGRDCIDIVLLHGPGDDLDTTYVQDAFESQVAAGRIKAYGASARTIGGARHFADLEFGTCLEWNFNLLERRPVTDLLPLLRAKRINFVARSPLYRGLLTEKFFSTRGRVVFEPDDVRSTLDDHLLDWIYGSARKIRKMAGRKGISISDLALSYVLSNEDVACVVPGIKKTDHLHAALKLWRGKVPENILDSFVCDLQEDHYPGFD